MPEKKPAAEATADNLIPYFFKLYDARKLLVKRLRLYHIGLGEMRVGEDDKNFTWGVGYEKEADRLTLKFNYCGENIIDGVKGTFEYNWKVILTENHLSLTYSQRDWDASMVKLNKLGKKIKEGKIGKEAREGKLKVANLNVTRHAEEYDIKGNCPASVILKKFKDAIDHSHRALSKCVERYEEQTKLSSSRDILFKATLSSNLNEENSEESIRPTMVVNNSFLCSNDC